MKTEELVAALEPGPSTGTSFVTIHLESASGVEWATDALFDTLGEDSSIAAVDVVMDGEHAGSLRREALFSFVQDRQMKLGDAAYSGLPGDPAPSYLILHCPAPSCPRRALMSPDLYGKPVLCPMHKQVMLK